MASVEKLPSGNYRGVAQFRDALGKRRRKSFTDKSERRALRLAENYEEEMQAHAPSSTTLLQAMEAYLDAVRSVLSPATMRGYMNIYNAMKVQHEAACALTAIHAEDSQALVAAMLKNGKSPKTISNRFGLISAACKHAKVPYEAPKLPRWELDGGYIPDEEDMRRILEDVRGTRLEIPVALGMFGLRRSEIAGLTLADLDGSVLWVHSATVYGEGNMLANKTTKTKKSKRPVRISDKLANLIRERGVILEMSPAALSCAFEHVVKRCGVKMTFHDLRHFFVSYCHNVLKLSDAQIQTLGGWSTNSVMRRHYLHAMHEAEAAENVAAALGKIG